MHCKEAFFTSQIRLLFADGKHGKQGYMYITVDNSLNALWQKNFFLQVCVYKYRDSGEFLLGMQELRMQELRIQELSRML